MEISRLRISSGGHWGCGLFNVSLPLQNRGIVSRILIAGDGILRTAIPCSSEPGMTVIRGDDFQSQSFDRLILTTGYPCVIPQGDRPGVRTVEGKDVSSRLQIVKALQMQTLSPAPPMSGRPHAPSPPKAKATSGSSSSGSAVNSKKLCAECSKPLSGLPLRCSGCKVIHYCSKDCQKNGELLGGLILPYA